MNRTIATMKALNTVIQICSQLAATLLGETYMAPVMNTRDTPIFSLRVSFRCHTDGRGRTKIKKSVITFIEAYTAADFLRSMQ